MKHLALLAGVVALIAALFYAAQGSSKAETTKPAEGSTAPAIDRTNVVAARNTPPSVPSPAVDTAPAVKAQDLEHANIIGLPEESRVRFDLRARRDGTRATPSPSCENDRPEVHR